MIEFGPSICSDVTAASRREWLVTNGIGGYASGTISGILTRRYHGLLFAAINPPSERLLLLSKLDERVTYNNQTYDIYANFWENGIIEPEGFIHLQCFKLDGLVPTWTYSFGEALLIKRTWMHPGQNTTFIQYLYTRGTLPLNLDIHAHINYRDHHATAQPNKDDVLNVEQHEQKLKITKEDHVTALYLEGTSSTIINEQALLKGIYLPIENYRGLDDKDSLYRVGTFQVELKPGEDFTIVASTEQSVALTAQEAYIFRKAYESNLLQKFPYKNTPAWIKQLVLSADQFIVARTTSGKKSGVSFDASIKHGHSIIAGYPWFTDWGRDTMISLPGLTLATGRPEIAASILRTYAMYTDQGMIPNRFPDIGEKPEYNTVDATLWFFQAAYSYYRATLDKTLITEIYPVLQSILEWHYKGTRYRIIVDEKDGLLSAGEPGIQLTWMDAKAGDWVVTPRVGKPVEINALWYNALKVMAYFTKLLDKNPELIINEADIVRNSFNRFWDPIKGYCYDVIDGTGGKKDNSLRPNQLLAVSLPFSPLDEAKQRKIVDVCARYLLTTYGLRSLDTKHPDYKGLYGGDRYERDGAYHQGTSWAWLIGPFLSAHLRVYKDPLVIRSFLEPFRYHLEDQGLGSISEIFDGDPPYAPRGCIAQAWSVGEVLRIWSETEQLENQNNTEV